MIDGILQIAIPVQDLGRAVTFYRDAVGLRFLFEAPPNMAFLDCGGVRILLGEGRPAASHEGAVVYFRSKAIDEDIERIRLGGGVIERAPALIAQLPDRDVWLAVFRDPEGNTLELMTEVVREGGAHA